jgi:hypothetical protein
MPETLEDPPKIYRKARMEDFLDDTDSVNTINKNNKNNKNYSNSDTNNIEKNQQEFGHKKRIKP